MNEYVKVPRHDLSELVDFIFRRFGSVADTVELPDHLVPCVRALENALAITTPAADDAKDAERYRWLRHNAKVSWATGYRDAELSWHFPEFRTAEWKSPAVEIDAAIDAAIANERGEG